MGIEERDQAKCGGEKTREKKKAPRFKHNLYLRRGVRIALVFQSVAGAILKKSVVGAN
jgi:hypothetical protein